MSLPHAVLPLMADASNSIASSMTSMPMFHCWSTEAVFLAQSGDLMRAPDLGAELLCACLEHLLDLGLRNDDPVRVVKGDRMQVQLEHREIRERRGTAPGTEPLEQSTMVEHLHAPRLRRFTSAAVSSDAIQSACKKSALAFSRL